MCVCSPRRRDSERSTAAECEAGPATSVLLLQQDATAELGPIGGDVSMQCGELVVQPGPQRSLSFDCS